VPIPEISTSSLSPGLSQAGAEKALSILYTEIEKTIA
jgi:hypothetical protein